MYVGAARYADRVSDAAQAIAAAQARQPRSVREIGFDESAERVHRHLADLYCMEGKPHLWYFSTFQPYEMEEYDFQSRQWNRVYAAPD